jgi:dTDP-4-amino-4,6-dideoxygalactose transaminase
MDWPPASAEIEEILVRMVRNGDWARYEGPQSEQLVERLKIQFGRSLVQLCCTGTMAVELALRGLRIQTGDEVLLAAYDFPGNFRAIEAVGARPVLVDLEPGRWSLLDPNALEAAAGPLVRAVLVTHLHGDLANMPAICQWASERGLAVIEDACQAVGGLIQHLPCGSWGDVSVISFGGSKLLSAGRGGAVMTDDERIFQRMRVYRDRGNDALAMSQLQAAVLFPQLMQLDRWHQERLVAVACAALALHPSAFVQSLPLDRMLEDQSPAFYKWGLRVAHAADRPVLIDWLKRKGIQCGEGFRGFVRRSPRRCRSVGNLQHAKALAEQTVLVHHTELCHGEASGRRLAEILGQWNPNANDSPAPDQR